MIVKSPITKIQSWTPTLKLDFSLSKEAYFLKFDMT